MPKKRLFPLGPRGSNTVALAVVVFWGVVWYFLIFHVADGLLARLGL